MMKPRVLLVDDEKLNLMTLEAFLVDDGYELHFAEDGRTAFELARSLTPDLILLDVMMPEVDGFTVCRRIRNDPAIGHVPIIIVTALHDMASRLEGLRAGADDFVTKPCSRDEIRARVRTVVSLNRFRTIAEQRARFERVHDLAPVGIIVTDESGVVVTANPCAEALLAGPEGRALCGDMLADRFEPVAGVAVHAMVQTALAGLAMPARELRRWQGRDERVLRMRGAVVPESGERRVMLIVSDITTEVHAREALEKMNRELDALVHARTRQLEEANALLMSYASFVSHDLRSPLSVMKGYLSMIHDGAVALPDARPLLDRAYAATEMMEELVQNILQLARDEHDGAQTDTPDTDPKPIIERIWFHLGSLFPNPDRRLAITPLPTIRARPLLVERVFYNLLTNAAKYSASRPQPTIEVGAIDLPEGPAIFVRDNGVGFDQRDADRLFREFSRLPDVPATDGFGLGLSLVSRLIKAHGGRIWAEGKADVGATFYVQFSSPTTKPALAPAAPPP